MPYSRARFFAVSLEAAAVPGNTEEPGDKKKNTSMIDILKNVFTIMIYLFIFSLLSHPSTHFRF
jgi:hypothetical protein